MLFLFTIESFDSTANEPTRIYSTAIIKADSKKTAFQKLTSGKLHLNLNMIVAIKYSGKFNPDSNDSRIVYHKPIIGWLE